MLSTTRTGTAGKPATEALDDSDVLVCSSQGAGSEESSDASVTKAPRMIAGSSARAHVFDGAPEDVHFYFIDHFLLGETPLETAEIRGLYARISKAHNAEMFADRQRPENAWLNMVRSAALIPVMARRTAHGKHAQVKLAAGIDELVKTHAQLVLPLSALKEKSAQVTVLYRVLVAEGPKDVVIDYSAPANGWKQKHPDYMPFYNSRGSWRHQQKLLQLMQSIPRANKRELRIDLLLCNRLVEPMVLQTLMKAGEKVLRTVRKLDLSGLIISRVEHEYRLSVEFCMRVTAKTLQHLPTLEEFRLCDSVIDSHMLHMLCAGLNGHQKMKVLALGGNLLCRNFGANEKNLLGWTALMAEITGMPALRELDLSRNKVGDEAADMLLTTLKLIKKGEKKLQKVDLRGNHIRKEHPIWQDERVIGD